MAAREAVVSLASTGELASYAERVIDGNEDRKKKRSQIRLVLNDFELASLAIQRGAMDFTIYKRFARPIVINYWKKTLPFIARVREVEDNDLLFHEFETLYRWMNEKRKPSRIRWFGLWF